MLGALLGVLLAGFPSTPQSEPLERPDLTDSKNLLPTFKQLILSGNFTKAHTYCLSVRAKQAIPEDKFQLAFLSIAADLLNLLVASLEEHGLTEDRIRICSPEFGISRDFRIVKGVGNLWALDFTPEDIQHFQEQVRAWNRKQREAAGGRHFVYPPDWKYANLMSRCACRKDGP